MGKIVSIKIRQSGFVVGGLLKMHSFFMEADILKKLEEVEQKINAMCISIEKLRRYFLWTLIITLVTVILPIVALIVVAPWALDVLSDSYTIQ